MPDRTKTSLTLLLCVTALGGCDRSATGADAYREGRFKDALAAFADAEKRAGDGASPELLYDKALAALRAGQLAEAESSADRAAARGGPEFAALRDFVRGNVAFARCLMSEAQANRPEAEPFALDVAIAYAESARRSWMLASTSRDDWPPARRNAERAALAVERLKSKKADADKKRRPSSEPRAKPAPGSEKPEDVPQAQRDPRKGEGEDPTQKPTTVTQEAELPPDQVLRLLDKLAEREREKVAVRRARRQAQSSEAEKDW